MIRALFRLLAHGAHREVDGVEVADLGLDVLLRGDGAVEAVGVRAHEGEDASGVRLGERLPYAQSFADGLLQG